MHWSSGFVLGMHWVRADDIKYRPSTRADPSQICIQGAILKSMFPLFILCVVFSFLWSFDIGYDRCLWGGEREGKGERGRREVLVRKKTIFDCLWVNVGSSRQGGLQRLAGGAVSESQPLLYP